MALIIYNMNLSLQFPDVIAKKSSLYFNYYCCKILQ